MPNLVKRYNDNKEVKKNQIVKDLCEALNQDKDTLRCVGVMIQAGKTLIEPKNAIKTAGGGHVSPFVVESKGQLLSWDETMDDSWVNGFDADDNDALHKSSLNDVTIYVHPATDIEVETIKNRAEALVSANNLEYSHIPTLTSAFPTKGDCVTKSAWIMGSFSYSKPMQGAVTPWGQAVLYEFYTSPLNQLSQWVKVKYIGWKLETMT